MKRIFVSSTFIDLEQHRVAVRDELNRADMHAVGMEHFGSQPRGWKQAVFKEMDTCDAVVGIYAYRYGTIPENDVISITEQEFDYALAKGMPRFFYVVRPGYAWSEDWKDTGDQKARLERFLKKLEPLQKSVFDTPDDLARKVMADLYKFEQNASRAREEMYLAQFAANDAFQDAARHFVPLAGILQSIVSLADSLQPALRLSDDQDPNYSKSGIPLQDVREALTQHDKKKIVILGEPGAGKTTILRRLALDLADERGRDPTKKIPFRVNLSDFVGAGLLPSEFLKQKWETTGPGKPIREMLLRGEVCFLLDGINQMPFSDRAQRIGLGKLGKRGLARR